MKDKNYRTNIYQLLQTISYAKKYRQIAKKLTLNIDSSKDLYLNIPEVVLMKILQNIIFNAIKYSYSNTTITIKVIENKRNLHIECINYGLGIDRDERYAIFNYERRGEKINGYIDNIEGEKIEYISTANENIGVGLL